MLIWVCALHCEAKPVIDFYRLKKSQQTRTFELYQGDNSACIISGPGKLASAAATAWAAASFEQHPAVAWINLGIAGAADRAPGSIFLVNQVTDADTRRSYYPVATGKSALAKASCISLSQPSFDYHPSHLFDMEASGFLATALRFSSAELCQCIKIVSDNQSENSSRDKHKVGAWIEQHIQLIDQQARQLQALSAQLADLQVPAEAWQQLASLARFSQTQQARLRVLLAYLLGRDYSMTQILQHIGGADSSKTILESLQQLGYRDSSAL